MRTVTDRAWIQELATASIDDVVVDPSILESYRRDQAAPGMVEAGIPSVVVRPRTTREVQAALSVAAHHSVPVVPRGAGSGLSGGANAIDGCMVLGLERMTDVRDLDAASMTATVQAGVVNEALRRAASTQQLWYAPDPASSDFSTIGGNVATNAGGLCCVKYGVTRDAITGLEVVLSDGRVVRLGGQTRKGVAGYDLVGLMCGSEGTLGVITEVTARLLPVPPRANTLAASFSELAAAGTATARIRRETTPALLELMDATTIAAVERFKPMGLESDAAVLLFARSDAPSQAGLEEIQRMADWCEQAGATLVVTSDEDAEGRMLMAARRLAYPALEHMGATLLDDVAVPVGRIPHLLDGIEAIADRYGLTIGTFGHAGDGNMHPTIVYDARNEAAVEATRSAFDAIVQLAISLNGTVTGEHGVGLLKRSALGQELGDAHRLHFAVKRALDPIGILNPRRAI